MNWISQNWLWLLAAVGIVVLLRRGGVGGCGHSHGRHGRRHDQHDDTERQSDSRSDMARDPVTGESVSTVNAPSTVYAGRTYYFKSADNRRRFEASPTAFIDRDRDSTAPPSREHEHRHRGC